MLRVASHSKVPPYCAVTAGPNSHSPEPMDAPAKSTPGPMTLSQRRQPRPGGGGSSPTVHGGSCPAGTTPSSGFLGTGSSLTGLGLSDTGSGGDALYKPRGSAGQAWVPCMCSITVV